MVCHFVLKETKTLYKESFVAKYTHFFVVVVALMLRLFVVKMEWIGTFLEITHMCALSG